MKLFSLCVLVVLGLTGWSQALFNNRGADIHVTDGGFIIIKNNSLHNISGTINNQGTITVEGSVTNDATITGNGDTIRLFQDWINNSAYSGMASWVDLYGGDQQITGSSITTFDNLNLGGSNTMKRQTIDAITASTLALNSAELATDNFEMLVNNPSPAAITRTMGFTSSVGNGRLSRVTNSAAPYLFPTGSPSYVNAPSIFRPVNFTPSSAGTNTYGARLLKNNATNDSYNTNAMDEQLCAINPNFYHWLYHSSGTDALALTMHFNPAQDGDWSDQAHWDTPNQWNYLGNPSAGNNLGLSTITVSGVSDFSPQPFALAKRKFSVDAGNPVSVTTGNSATLNPIIGSTSIASIQWTPTVTLSCGDCENPVATPQTTTYYTITVTDRAGCIVSDSVLVSVINDLLLIPTAFSPNGDAMNDFFTAFNNNLSKFNLQVFNRWGEKVFESANPDDGWDGTFRNVEQPLGVYTWQCQYQFTGTTKLLVAKGNVTLLR